MNMINPFSHYFFLLFLTLPKPIVFVLLTFILTWYQSFFSAGLIDPNTMDGFTGKNGRSIHPVIIQCKVNFQRA